MTASDRFSTLILVCGQGYLGEWKEVSLLKYDLSKFMFRISVEMNYGLNGPI